MPGKALDYDVVRSIGTTFPDVKDASGSANGENQGTYYSTDQYAPYPAISVRLSRIKRNALKELLSEAWEFVREETA